MYIYKKVSNDLLFRFSAKQERQIIDLLISIRGLRATGYEVIRSQGGYIYLICRRNLFSGTHYEVSVDDQIVFDCYVRQSTCYVSVFRCKNNAETPSWLQLVQETAERHATNNFA